MISGFSGRVLAVVGDVILDRFIYGRADRVSPEAPALVLQIEDEKWILGGAANVAANIASLGAEAILVGRIGDDDGAATIDQLARAFDGRITLALAIDPHAPTTVKTRYVAGDRHLLRADREHVGLSESCEQAVIANLQSAITRAHVVVVSDYDKGVVTDAVLKAIFQLAAAQAKPVVVDPKRRDLSVYRGATVLTPNRRELTFATGLKLDSSAAIDQAAALAIEQCDASMLVTLSENGVSLHRRGEPVWREQATAKRVRDVSGAGDTLAGVLALALASGADLPASASLANLAAGVAVGKSGTSTVLPGELIAARDQALAARARMEATEGMTKVLSLTAAVALRETWGDGGLTVGFTNGCFDLLHPGHVKILRGAAAQCDRLIVGLNTDASVRRLKGKSRPIQTELARAAVLEALEPVDMVVLFGEDTPLRLIENLLPDVLFKGADYSEEQVVGGEVVRRHGGRVVLIDLARGHSTTDLIARSTPTARQG